MSFDFLTAIKNIAPMVASTFGTPLLGMAVSAVCGAIPPDAAKQVQEAHAADPVNGALSKLGELFQQGVINSQQIKQAELDHSAKMAELGYKSVADLAKLEVDDRDSARKREEAIKDSTPSHLAYMIIGGFIIVSIAQLVALVGWPDQVAKIPPAGWAIIGNISGYLFAEAKQAAAYYFGSSMSSRAKDDTLATIAKNGNGDS